MKEGLGRARASWDEGGNEGERHGTLKGGNNSLIHCEGRRTKEQEKRKEKEWCARNLDY